MDDKYLADWGQGHYETAFMHYCAVPEQLRKTANDKSADLGL